MEIPIRFGTDGWRAIIAETFTFENVRYCAQAMSNYLNDSGLSNKGVVIGYDTRFASSSFATAAAEIFAANAIKVYLATKPIPTPVVSYTILDKKAGGGIVITASHNGWEYNGIKIKDEYGSSASDKIIMQVVHHVNAAEKHRTKAPMSINEAIKQNIVTKEDFNYAYFKHIANLVNLDRLRNAGLNIVFDPMYGAGSGYLLDILSGNSNHIFEIHNEHNPLFPGIQPEPIMPNLITLGKTVIEQCAHVGLATDGDADRIGIVDEYGEFISQSQVFALLALYMLEVRGERGPIIKTTTTTNMAFRLGEIFHIPIYETSVGFKYIAPLMREKNAIMGGEESGGYAFHNHVVERDGILSCLYFLDLMINKKMTPSQLVRCLINKVGNHYYTRKDISIPSEYRKTIIERLSNPPEIIDGVRVIGIDRSDGYRFNLEDNTWLLIRFSGTEPLVRIYAETNFRERTGRLLRYGLELMGLKAYD